jgi:predicted DNA-binding protein
MEYDKTIPVRVPEETRLALDAEAQKRGVKLAWLVREILTQHTNDPALTACRSKFVRAPEGMKVQS